MRDVDPASPVTQAARDINLSYISFGHPSMTKSHFLLTNSAVGPLHLPTFEKLHLPTALAHCTYQQCSGPMIQYLLYRRRAVEVDRINATHFFPPKQCHSLSVVGGMTETSSSSAAATSASNFLLDKSSFGKCDLLNSAQTHCS